MAEKITAEDVAAAEASLISIKESSEPGSPERTAAMQAVNDLRMAYRLQEEQDPASQRSAGHTPVAVDNDGSEG